MSIDYTNMPGHSFSRRSHMKYMKYGAELKVTHHEVVSVRACGTITW